MVWGAQGRGRSSQHLHGRLRISEALQATLTQRIKRNDGSAALSRLLQLMHHARAIAADVLAEEENTIGLSEIVERHSPDRHADAFGKRDRGAFMAHIGG